MRRGKANKYMYLEGRACVCFNGRYTTLKTCARTQMSRFGNYLSPWRMRVLVMDKEQAPSRNEGRRAFFLLFLLLALGLGEARSGVTGRGETCSLRKSKSTQVGTIPCHRSAVALCGEGGRDHLSAQVVCVSRPGSEAGPGPRHGISEGTRQLAQARPGFGPLPVWARSRPGRGYMARPPCTTTACQFSSVPSLALRFRLSSCRSSPLSQWNSNIGPRSTLF